MTALMIILAVIALILLAAMTGITGHSESRRGHDLHA